MVIKGKRRSIGKIADSLNGFVSFLFVFGNEIRQKEVVDIKSNITNYFFEFGDRL